MIKSCFSTDLSPPTISPESLTINEGSDRSIFCLSSSPRALVVDEMWLNPQMVAAAEGFGNILSFVNISRSQSGVYRCILTSGATNQTETADFPVTVNCEYCMLWWNSLTGLPNCTQQHVIIYSRSCAHSKNTSYSGPAFTIILVVLWA